MPGSSDHPVTPAALGVLLDKQQTRVRLENKMQTSEAVAGGPQRGQRMIFTGANKRMGAGGTLRCSRAYTGR